MLKAFAGGFNFAHLIGLGRSKSQLKASTAVIPGAQTAVAEEEECEEEEIDEGANGEKAAKSSSKKKGNKDDGEEDNSDGGEEDGDEDEEEEAESSEGEKKGGKKGDKKGDKKAETPAAAKVDAGAYKRGRKAERRRVGLILSHSAAANNIGLALKLACNTGMASAAAIALLEATPAASRSGRLDRQMQGEHIPDVKAGAADAPSGDAAIAASWDNAMKAYSPRK